VMARQTGETTKQMQLVAADKQRLYGWQNGDGARAGHLRPLLLGWIISGSPVFVLVFCCATVSARRSI